MDARIQLSLLCFACTWFTALSCNKIITESRGTIAVKTQAVHCIWLLMNHEPSTHVEVRFRQKKNMPYFAEVWNYNSSAFEQYGLYNNDIDRQSIIVPNSALVIVAMESEDHEYDFTFYHQTTTKAANRDDDTKSGYSRKCSRTVEQKISHIQNNEYPNNPPRHVSCLWYFPVKRSEILKMSLAREKDLFCNEERYSMAFWELHEGSIEEINAIELDEWTLSHPLFVYWHTRHVAFDSGFRLPYEIASPNEAIAPTTVPRCNETISSGSGVIASQNYPLYYAQDTDCMWLFEPKQGHAIDLDVRIINLYNYDNFEDYLDIWMIEDEKVVFVGDHRTLGNVQSIKSTEPLLVKFHTDVHEVSSGFKIPYQFYDSSSSKISEDKLSKASINTSMLLEEHECRQRLTDRRTTIILHPGDKTRRTSRKFSCMWILERQATEQTLIYFEKPINDYFTEQFQIWSKSEDKMTNIAINTEERLVKVTGIVLMHFKYFDTWDWSKPFEILIRPAEVTKCSLLISEFSGVIGIEAGYLYKEEQNCLWYFRPQKNQKVRLDVLETSFLSNTEDFLNIWEVNDGAVSLLANYQSLLKLQHFQSTKPMVVQFHSAEQTTQSHFEIKYLFEPVSTADVANSEMISTSQSVNCRKTIDTLSGRIESSEMKSENEDEKITCMWILKRNTEETTMLYEPNPSLSNLKDQFRVWDQLETSPQLREIWNLPGRKPYLMKGTVMIEMVASRGTELPAFSIRYKTKNNSDGSKKKDKRNANVASKAQKKATNKRRKRTNKGKPSNSAKKS